jgi:hypothetical protein
VDFKNKSHRDNAAFGQSKRTPADEKSFRRWCKKRIYVVSRFIAALLAAILQCSRRVGAEIELNRLKQMQQPAPLAFSCRARALVSAN